MDALRVRAATLLVSVSFAASGCNCGWYKTRPAPWARTFVTQEVEDGKPIRGHPFLQYQMKVVEATWARKGDWKDTYTTLHVAMVPKLMAIDAERAFLGTTKAEFENYEDGSLKTSKNELDQKIPELIQAAGTLIKSLPQREAPKAAPTPSIQPDLKPSAPEDTLISLKCLPLDCESALACTR